jgi:hypothetical protein
VNQLSWPRRIRMVYMSEHTEMTGELARRTTIARSAAAERMRAHRSRRRAGPRCIVVQLRETEIDVLIQKGLLEAVARNDTRAVRKALHTYLDRTLSKAL